MSLRRCRRFAAVVLAVLGLATAACRDSGSVRVRSLVLKGTNAADESRLRAALATQASSIFPWGRQRSFSRSDFDADLKRVQAFYADRGYPDARVASFNVMFNGDQDAVDLTVTISEGEPVRVRSLEFTGFDVIPPSSFSHLRKQAPLKAGQPLDRELVLTTHEMAINDLKDYGYPYAAVETSEEPVAGTRDVQLIFKAEPGPIAYFGPIQIQGNETVGDHVIEHELTFKPGDLYSRSVVRDSQRRLYNLELFQFVDIQSVDGGAQPARVPMKVTVTEGRKQRVSFSGGYGTEEKARAEVEYRRLNFLGDARSVGAHVRWSSLDRGAQIDFTQPYFLHPGLSLGGQAQRWYTFTPAYNSTTTGGKITVAYRVHEPTSFSVSASSERTTSAIASDVLSDLSLRNALIGLGLDPRTDEQTGVLDAIGFDFRRSTSDDTLNANHGYLVLLHLEDAGHFLPGTFGYWLGTVDARHYLPIGGATTVASRLQLGNISPEGGVEAKVPFARKFFLGGASSVRGWGRYELSPLSSSGLPLGGNSLMSFSSELRRTLAGKLGAVWFLDGGNVWAGSWDLRLGDLHYAVGAGLRYETPVGPVRFDVGYQLNTEPGLLVNGQPESRQWRMHFSIGQAF